MPRLHFDQAAMAIAEADFFGDSHAVERYGDGCGEDTRRDESGF
jgi:hypothetical protein